MAQSVGFRAATKKQKKPPIWKLFENLVGPVEQALSGTPVEFGCSVA